MTCIHFISIILIRYHQKKKHGILLPLHHLFLKDSEKSLTISFMLKKYLERLCFHPIKKPQPPISLRTPKEEKMIDLILLALRLIDNESLTALLKNFTMVTNPFILLVILFVLNHLGFNTNFFVPSFYLSNEFKTIHQA